MEWMHGGGRDPNGRGLDEEIKLGKEDWMERQRVAQGGRIGLQSGQLVQPGPGRQGYSGDDVKNIVDFAIKKSKHSLRPGDVQSRARLEELYREIKKYNAMDDITVEVKSTHPKQAFQKRDLSEKMLLEKAGFKSKTGQLPAARYLIDNYFLTTADKMERDIKRMMSSSDTKLSDAVDFTQKLSTKYNRDLRQVQKTIENFPTVKENKELLLKLTNPQATAKFKRNKHFDLMTIGDVIDEAHFKADFSIKVVNPEQTLQSYAYKHTFVHDGDKIQWLTDPHKTPQSEWVFKYNGKTYDQHALSPMNSRKDPNFAKFWKTDEQILNYLDHKITDPEILKKLGYKKPTTMGTIMKGALSHGTGSKGYFMFEPLERDHINLKKDPFDVRPMNKRFNIGEGTLKKALLEGRISRAEYNQGIKKIGYEYMGGLDLDDPKAFDDLIKRDLDFAVKAKTRSKEFLRTPATLAREHSSRLSKEAVESLSSKDPIKDFLKLAPKKSAAAAAAVVPAATTKGRIDEALKGDKFKGMRNLLKGELWFAAADFLNNLTKGQSIEKAFNKAKETASWGLADLDADEKALIKHATEQGASEEEIGALRNYLNYMKKYKTYETANKMFHYAKENLGQGTGSPEDIGTTWKDVTSARENLKLREGELENLYNIYAEGTPDMQLGKNMLTKYIDSLAAEEWNKTAGTIIDRGARPNQGEGIIWGGVGALARDIGAIATGQMPKNFWDYAVPAQIDPWTKDEKQIRLMERPAVGTNYPEYDLAREDMKLDLGYALQENYAEGGIVGLLKK